MLGGGAERWAALRLVTLRRILARNLKRLRKERGLTQEELADLAGLNRNYVGMIERQENAASVDTLEALARSLQVDPIRVDRAVGDPRAARWGRRLRIEVPRSMRSRERVPEIHAQRRLWVVRENLRPHGRRPICGPPNLRYTPSGCRRGRAAITINFTTSGNFSVFWGRSLSLGDCELRNVARPGPRCAERPYSTVLIAPPLP